MSLRVGLTTTVPIEVLYAAGVVPVDLNNVFITSPDALALLEQAEQEGFPRNVCGWIKGIFATARAERIDTVIAVTQGDCSHTHAMIEVMEDLGITVIPFAYPYDRDRDLLALQIEKLRERFGASPEDVRAMKKRLDEVRRVVREIDLRTFRDGTVTGFENHLWQVSCSDMEGDIDRFEQRAREFLREVDKRRPERERLPLGFVGIPPIFSGLYELVEECGARIVYNELQRQFAMPFDTEDLVEQYTLYTYPYGIFARLEDIKREIRRRGLRGLIHYTQSFCFRQISDIILRRHVDLPILTLEGDRPGPISAGVRVRVESFIEMLRAS